MLCNDIWILIIAISFHNFWMSQTSSTNVLPETWQYWVVLNAMVNGKRIYQIEKVFAFNTVENFWSYQEALPKISEFRNVNNKRVSLALFRGEIQPAWEDPENENGATFSFAVPTELIDEFWETLVLYFIGGQMQKELFEGEQEICGAFVKNNTASEFFVELWTKSDIDRRTDITDYIHTFELPMSSDEIKFKDYHTHKSKTSW